MDTMQCTEQVYDLLFIRFSIALLCQAVIYRGSDDNKRTVTLLFPQLTVIAALSRQQRLLCDYRCSSDYAADRIHLGDGKQAVTTICNYGCVRPCVRAGARG